MFGKRLYAQIVWPFVIAAVIVGGVATTMGAYFLLSITTRWVDEVAEHTLEDLESRFRSHTQDMEQMANLAVANTCLVDAVAAGDMQEARDVLTIIERASNYDGIQLVDAKGTTIASAGLLSSEFLPGFLAAELPAGAINTSPALRMTSNDAVALTVSRPLIAGGQAYELRITNIIDRHFLSRIASGARDAVAIYDARGNLVTFLVSDTDDSEEQAVESLRKVFDRMHPSVASAIDSAGKTLGQSTLRTPTGNYRVLAAGFDVVGRDSSSPSVYLVAIVSQALSDEARNTTTTLIIIWSVVAVLALAGLGFWVAKRVSDPLSALAVGARRIIQGDFSTRILVGGSSEIADLAETFNDMTDSLRERSEALTKKVLELATLYEMSRALGSTLEMDELLDSVLDAVLRIFGVDIGYVMLVDQETGRLKLRASREGNLERPGVAAACLSMSEWVVREGRPLIFNPTSGQLSDQGNGLARTSAGLCVPLVSTEGTFGAITVGSTKHDTQFTSDDVRLLSTIANHVTIAIGNIELFSSLQEAYLATVRALAAAVDAKDPYTRGHSERVAGFALRIGKRMDLSRDQMIALEMAAYLHDIGKIGVSEDILLKPGQLADDEMTQMRYHPLIGANILKPVWLPWPITPVVRHHHEHWDGSGYPAGLRGEEIPLLARILSVADAYEAMIADRPYRAGRTFDDAIAELRRCAGSQFDPKIVDTFVELLKEEDRPDGRCQQVEPTCPEEAQAIFVILVEGVLASFRRLAGPRLATNVEVEINDAFAMADLAFRVKGGKVSFISDGGGSPGADQMRAALRTIDEVLARVSGASLIDHFYGDAFEGLTNRMRLIAVHLDFLARQPQT